MIQKISTAIIVKTVFSICSVDCDVAVTEIFSLPLKYPFNTAEIATINTDGDSAIITVSASGIPKNTFAIRFALKNNIDVPIKPISPNIEIATLNILYAPLLSPTAALLDIN